MVNGYANGARLACPDCKIMCAYANSFGNQNKEGEQYADLFNKQEADILFNAASGTGTAALKAFVANRKPVIGEGTGKCCTSSVH